MIMRLSPLCITGVLVAATAAGCSSNAGALVCEHS